MHANMVKLTRNSQCPEILGEPLPEGLRGEKVVHHPDDTRALRVGYPVRKLPHMTSADVKGMGSTALPGLQIILKKTILSKSSSRPNHVT